jgi:DNA-binding phage protein
MATRTGAERYFTEQQRDPEYRRAYTAARARIARTDALVRSLDERRVARGLTKAALARAAGVQPEVVRRLFTMDSPNPTAATLLALAEALDLEVVARPKKRPARKMPAKAKTVAAKKPRKRTSVTA